MSALGRDLLLSARSECLVIMEGETASPGGVRMKIHFNDRIESPNDFKFAKICAY